MELPGFNNAPMEHFGVTKEPLSLKNESIALKKEIEAHELVGLLSGLGGFFINEEIFQVDNSEPMPNDEEIDEQVKELQMEGLKFLMNFRKEAEFSSSAYQGFAFKVTESYGDDNIVS